MKGHLRTAAALVYLRCPLSALANLLCAKFFAQESKEDVADLDLLIQELQRNHDVDAEDLCQELCMREKENQTMDDLLSALDALLIKECGWLPTAIDVAVPDPAARLDPDRYLLSRCSQAYRDWFLHPGCDVALTNADFGKVARVQEMEGPARRGLFAKVKIKAGSKWAFVPSVKLAASAEQCQFCLCTLDVERHGSFMCFDCTQYKVPLHNYINT